MGGSRFAKMAGVLPSWQDHSLPECPDLCNRPYRMARSLRCRRITLIAVLFLQPQCNMTCLFCVTEDGFHSLTLEEGMSMVRTLKAHGVDNVILGGGEPFAWKPGPLELARFAKSLGMTVQIGTNGISLPPGFETCPWVDRYILPLESSQPEPHDILRHHKGGHHKIILGRLETLGRAAKAVTVSTVITRENVDSIGDLGRLLGDYHRTYGNLHAWHLYRLISAGRGGSRHGPRLDVGKEEYHRVCDQVRLQESSLRILKRPDMLHSSSVGFFWMQGKTVRSQSPYKVEFPP